MWFIGSILYYENGNGNETEVSEVQQNKIPFSLVVSNENDNDEIRVTNSKKMSTLFVKIKKLPFFRGSTQVNKNDKMMFMLMMYGRITGYFPCMSLFYC